MRNTTRGANGAGRLVSIITLRVVVVIALVTMSDAAHADGKFFGIQKVGKDPTIRSQSAIIVHRDGVQTLIVGSHIDTGAGSMGWILPLPAEPTEIDLATIGTLETLEMMLQPRVLGKRELNDTGGLALLVLWFSLLTALLILTGHVEGRTKRSVWQFFVIFLMLGIGFLLLPSLGTARGGVMVPGLSIVQSEPIGPYEVNVLRGDNVGAISEWCGANGIVLSKEEQSVVESYRADGWCFLTAILSPETDGVLQQPPLRVTFPADHPIYPMRLTGVAENPLDLDLFVFAATGMHAEGLATWWRDTPVTADPESINRDFSGRTIGHPQIVPLLWDGAIVSRLHGRLDHDDMQRDITLLPDASEPHRHEFISVDHALWMMIWWFGFGLSITLPVVAWLWDKRRARFVTAIVMLAISAAVAMILGITTLDISRNIEGGVSIGTTINTPFEMRRAGTEMIEKNQLFQSIVDARSEFLDRLAFLDESLGPRTDIIVDRDVPLGVIFEERDGAYFATTFDMTATPHEHRIGRVGDPESDR